MLIICSLASFRSILVGSVFLPFVFICLYFTRSVYLGLLSLSVFVSPLVCVFSCVG